MSCANIPFVDVSFKLVKSYYQLTYRFTTASVTSQPASSSGVERSSCWRVSESAVRTPWVSPAHEGIICTDSPGQGHPRILVAWTPPGVLM